MEAKKGSVKMEYLRHSSIHDQKCSRCGGIICTSDKRMVKSSKYKPKTYRHIKGQCDKPKEPELTFWQSLMKGELN